MSELGGPNILAESVVELTINAIREAIRDGRFARGQRLVVADLTREFQVSAGPVREAVRRLTGEGLIDIIPHRGAVVRQFSVDEVREIFQVREAVEGLAARLAAANINLSDNRARLQASWGEMSAAAAGQPGQYVKHNHDLHELIAALASNNKMKEIIVQLTLPIFRLRYHRLIEAAYIAVSVREHERFIEAILLGDQDSAERAMREHVRNSGTAMLDSIAAGTLPAW